MNFPRILFLVHGGPESIEAVRARGLTQGYPAEKLRFAWRDLPRWAAARQWRHDARSFKPDLVYVLNTAMPGAWLACWLRLRHGLPFVLDSGDVIYEMARSAGTVPAWQRPALRLTETLAQRLAHTIVVRGTRHKNYLESRGYPRVTVIRDGFTPRATPSLQAVAELKARLGLADAFVVGVMGSLVYSPRLRLCYGWDLVQALTHLRDLPIRGLIIGDGPGRPWLEAQARLHQVSHRLTFCGRIPYPEVPLYLRLLDVALSTQTNNLAGQVRTTGKLPEYMAAGRFIVASRVGEAALLLPELMLLDYAGAVDTGYPASLAERLRRLWTEPALLSAREGLPSLAHEHCAYDVLSQQFNQVVSSVRQFG